MSAIPSKHLAVGFTSPDSGLVAFEVPTPEPSKDEVLVRVDWAPVTFTELWQVDFKALIFGYPSIFGISISGEVVKAGEDSGLKVGDKVISYSMLSNEERAFREYALLSKYKVAKVG